MHHFAFEIERGCRLVNTPDVPARRLTVQYAFDFGVVIKYHTYEIIIDKNKLRPGIIFAKYK